MSTRSRNHDDLPILDELGHDLVTAFVREERAEAVRRNRRRLRRIAAATAALFVVVPGAVATRYIWAPDPAVNAPGTPFTDSRPIQIADGRTDVLTWRISAFMGERGLCWQFETFTPTESFGRRVDCIADNPTDVLDVGASYDRGETLVFGWIAPEVARVTVRTPVAPERDAQIIVAPQDRIEKGGLPAGLKFYIASFPGGSADDGPPLVAAFDAAGRELERLPPRR